MEPHRGIHHRLHSKRQGLGGVLGGLVPNGSGSTSSSAQHGLQTPAASGTTGNPSGFGGIIGEFTSLLGDTPPSSGHSSATTSTTPLTLSSSSATSSTTTPTSSVHPTTSATSTTTSSALTTSTPTPTPTPTSSAPDTVYTSSNGTTVVYITSTLPAASATPPHPTSFLQNPSLEVGIFTLVGIAVLIIVCVTITWFARKRRRDRLERDLATAITFDPGVVDRYERQESSMEKHRLSVSSSGHGHGYGYGYGYGYGVQPAYAPPQEYHGPMGYGQYPMAAYHAPSPSTLPYQAPSPAVPQPVAQSGTNLTRKFSDRKPVPPLLPNPAYDPSDAHVSIPSQFYHQ